jgi:hypothetical protein
MALSTPEDLIIFAGKVKVNWPFAGQNAPLQAFSGQIGPYKGSGREFALLIIEFCLAAMYNRSSIKTMKHEEPDEKIRDPFNPAPAALADMRFRLGFRTRG